MDFLSKVSSLDESRPSLFELVAQDQLRDLLLPAVRYVLAYYAERHPRYLLPVANRTDEVYAALSILVEGHFLDDAAASGGSFTENFYGLKRARTMPGLPSVQRLHRTASVAPAALSRALRLRRKDRWLAILMLVGVPYVKAKLDHLWEVHGAPDALLRGRGGGAGDEDEEEDEPIDPRLPWRQRLRLRLLRLFKRYWPHANATFHLSSLAFQLAYLFGHSRHHSFSLWLIGQHCVRLDAQDYKNMEDRAAQPFLASFPDTDSSLSPLALARWIGPQVFDTLKIALPLGIFFLKFLEWWGQSDFAKQLARTTTNSVELPPPRQAQGRKTLSEFSNLPPRPDGGKGCSLCGRARLRAPTALPTGYVFCYACAHAFVTKHGSCPASGLKLLQGVEGLRRLRV